jgi:hypothetical protein
MKPVAIFTLTICIFACGCTQAPERIQPFYVSSLTYSNLSCPQLAEEESRVNAAYVMAAAHQSNLRRRDTVGYVLFGLPLGSMTGKYDVASDVAYLKGQQIALHQTEIQKNCNTLSQPPAANAATLSPTATTTHTVCTHQQQVDARIAKTNGYTGGPNCD